MKLANKAAIVTGAGRNIGRELSVAFAKEGESVACVVMDEGRANSVTRRIKDDGGEAVSIKCDVSDVADIAKMVSSTIEAFDGVDILVNNAGIAGPIGSLTENDVAAWIDTIQVNLIGVYLCCRVVATSAGTGPLTMWARLYSKGKRRGRRQLTLTLTPMGFGTQRKLLLSI